MQSKGVVRFFLIIMTLVTLYQFLLMIPSNRIEKAAEQYGVSMGNDDPIKAKEFEVSYLDSVSSEKVFSFHSSVISRIRI